MTSPETKACPIPTPAVGATVKIQAEHIDPPKTGKGTNPEFVKGWEAFFAGAPDPEPNERWGEWGDWNRNNPYTDGWKWAKRAKASRECHTWTFQGTEQGEDGKWYAVLTRKEVNDYNDVMNGSGTGLGHHTVTEKVLLG